MSETTITVSLDSRIIAILDKLARVSEESREDTAARLIAAGIEHKGFAIPAGIPC
jgi:predicted transcriptional regulator